MKLQLFLLALSCQAAAGPVAGPAAAPSSLYADSHYWPFHVALVEPHTEGDRPLKAGQHGVLIRMEDPATVLADFGRGGLARIPLGRTDLAERAARIAAGSEPKDYPNYFMHVGPRLVERRGDLLGNFDFKLLGGHKWVLTLYSGAEAAPLAALAAALGEECGRLRDAGVFVMVMPLQQEGDPAFARVLDAAGLDLPFMHTHLAGPYATTFQHDTRVLPLLVLNDPDGRVLGSAAFTADSAAARLDQLLDLLPGP